MGVGRGWRREEAVEERLELLVLGGMSDPLGCVSVQGAEVT